MKLPTRPPRGKALLGTWRKEHLLSLKQAHTLFQTYQKLKKEVEARPRPR
jgi:hypothetical protein